MLQAVNGTREIEDNPLSNAKKRVVPYIRIDLRQPKKKPIGIYENTHGPTRYKNRYICIKHVIKYALRAPPYDL